MDGSFGIGLMILFFVPIIGLIAYTSWKNRAKQYVLSVRPYPFLSRATRDLTTDEWNLLGAKVTLIDMKDGPLKGRPVIAKEDLDKALQALGLVVDESWSSEVEGIHKLALKHPVKPEEPVKTSGTYKSPDGEHKKWDGSRFRPYDPKTGEFKPDEKKSDTTAPLVTGTETKPWTASDRSGDSSYYGFRSQKDGPFRPHSFSPKAEMLRPPRTPRVLISPEAYKRMILYVEFAPKEVGWQGTVKALQSGDFLIDMVYLLEQEVTPVETELSVEGRAKLQVEFKKKFGFAKSIEMGDALKFWGHSHVHMEVFPSSTDENTMTRFGNDGIEWYIRGIFNKFGKAKFDVYRFDRNYRFLDVPWAVVDTETGAVIKTEEPRGMWGGVFNRWSANAPAQSKPAAEAKPATKVESAKPETKAVSESDKPVAETAVATSEGGDTTGDTKSEVEETVVEAVKPVHMFDSLPEIIRPSEELRAEIRAEYDAKVDERTFRIWKSSNPSFDSGTSPGHNEFIDDRWVGDGNPGATQPQPVTKPDFPGKTEKSDDKHEAEKNSVLVNPPIYVTGWGDMFKQLGAWFAKLWTPKPKELKKPVYPNTNIDKVESVEKPKSEAVDTKPAGESQPNPEVKDTKTVEGSPNSDKGPNKDEKDDRTNH